MAITSLSAVTIGAPDNAFRWYFQSGGASLSSGITVGLGDGTETKLYLDANGVGFKNAGGFTTSFRCPAATAAQTLTFHYTAGSGEVYPDAVALAANNSSTLTTTPTTVSGFSVTLAAGGIYEFEATLLFNTSNVGTFPRFTLNGPTSDLVWYEVQGPPSVTTLLTTTGTRPVQQFTSWASAFSNATALPATGTAYAFRVRGTCRTTASGAVSVDAFASAASAVVFLAGSHMRFRKIN